VKKDEILPLRFAQGQNDRIRSSDAVLSRRPELMRRVCEGFTKSPEKRALSANLEVYYITKKITYLFIPFGIINLSKVRGSILNIYV